MKLVAIVATFFLGSISASFAQQVILPTLVVESIEITDKEAYAKLISEINLKMRSEHNVPLFLRAYSTDSLAGNSQDAFALSPSLTFESLLMNQQIFASDPSMEELRENLGAVSRSLGAKTYLKAVRFDGTNSPGVLLNCLVKTDNEAALLSYLNEWALTLVDFEEEPPMLNVFRVVGGNSSFTHLVSFNAVSIEVIGRFLDKAAADRWSLQYTTENDGSCSRVHQAIYFEVN